LQPLQLDSVLQSHSIAQSVVNKYIVRQMSRISTEGQEGFNHMLVKGISYMMFALMPLFALFIFLLNRKKAQYYIGTLIFSIHYHSFLFLLLTVSLVVNRSVGTSLTWLVPFIVCPFYLYLALRHVYDGSRMRMIGKTLLIGVFQFISIAILFLATTVISVLMF
jgi:hypothetical protein